MFWIISLILGSEGFRVSGFQGFRVSGFQGFRVSGFQVQGLGFKVSGVLNKIADP